MDSFTITNDEAKDEIQEIEYLYEHNEAFGASIRIILTPVGEVFSLKYPPQLDDQRCESQEFEVAGRQIYHAYLLGEYGPHEAIWKSSDNKYIVLMLVKPAPWTNISWFKSLVNDVCC